MYLQSFGLYMQDTDHDDFKDIQQAAKEVVLILLFRSPVSIL